MKGLELPSEPCVCHLKLHSVGMRQTFYIIHLIETTVLYILTDKLIIINYKLN